MSETTSRTTPSTGELATKKQPIVDLYNNWYTSGGWKYDYATEKHDLQRVATAVGIEPGAKILEIGCGMGFHSNVLHDLGYEVTGNDLSDEAIKAAKKAHGGPSYVCADTSDFAAKQAEHSYDAILARGHSWFHYELTANNRNGQDVPALLGKLFRLLRDDGAFILRIRTNFSGDDHDDGVVNNRFHDYVDVLRPFGNVVYISDRKGNLLFTEEAALISGDDIVIVVRKGPSRVFANFDRAVSAVSP